MDLIIQILPSVYEWLLAHGIKILLVIIVAISFRHFGKSFIEKLIKQTTNIRHRDDIQSGEKRDGTLIKIFQGIFEVLVWVISGMVVLSEMGVEIGPLIAAAGIAGLAFGFGGQYLIRDLIAGLFIVLENQYRVNDVVCLDNTCGLVEDMTIRMTTLRDLDGTVHHVPHGEVKRVSNMSKSFARVNIDIGVDYASNLEQVIEVINKVGNDLAQDSLWKDNIIKPPQFLRVDSFADSAIIVKILGDTKPLKQWEVAGELRKRLKIAFDQNGISIPFPQRVIRQA